MKYAHTHWYWHVFILSLAIICIVYQVIFEDTLAVNLWIHVFFAIGSTDAAMLAYMQRMESTRIVSFLNELLNFETRWFSIIDAGNIWKRVSYRNFVVFGLRTLRVCVPLTNFATATSLAVFPYSPWRLIPRVILNEFSMFPSGISFVSEICRRTVSFIFTYECMHFISNHELNMAATSFFSAQCSIFRMVLAFRRLLTATLDDYPNLGETRKLNKVVGMFREIQLFCLHFNDIHKLLVMPPFILLAVVATSVSIFVLVTAWESLDVQAAFIFSNMVVIGVTNILLLFPLAIKLFVESQHTLQWHTWFRVEQRFLASARYRRIIRKYWASFPALKI